MLTRLRQITLHPGLVPADYLDQLRAETGEMEGVAAPSAAHIGPGERLRLQNLLARAIEEMEECPICFEYFRDPRITTCAHIYCFECISHALRNDPRCPMVRWCPSKMHRSIYMFSGSSTDLCRGPYRSVTSKSARCGASATRAFGRRAGGGRK